MGCKSISTLPGETVNHCQRRIKDVVFVESKDRAQVVRKCSNLDNSILMNKQLDANIEADVLIFQEFIGR